MGSLILELEHQGCKRCGSSETKIEVLVPGRNISPSPEEEQYSTEIFCKDCGKIERTELPLSIR